MPLGDVEASALQVTSGLVYETLLDCSDGSYQPGLAESWDVSDDGMRLAVRVRSGVRWHDQRAFGVLDVQATIEPLLRKGTDAAALRAALADVAAVELVTERTVRFVLKRPSDLVLRALCDVPILPDHIIRGARAESAAARARSRSAPDRSASRAGSAASASAWSASPNTGARRRASTRSCSTSTPTRCARSTAPGAARSTCWRACSTCTTRSRSNRRRCTAAAALYRLPSLPLFVPGREPRALSAVRSSLPARRGDAVGSQPVLVRAARRSGAADRRTAARRRRRRRRAAVRSPARDRRCSRRPAIATATPTACAITRARPIRLTMLEPAGNKLFNVEARAFVLEMRKAGLLVDLVADRLRRPSCSASRRASSISCR